MLGLAASALPTWAAPGYAQTIWPTKPVSITVAYAGGGAIDGLIRYCTEQIQKRHPEIVFVIEYKPGAGGNIAADAVARMKGDGHQFLMTGSSTQAANVSLYKTLPFDPEKDFAPIASMATVPYILVVNPARVPVSTFQEFVAFVKSRPGQLSYASSAITGRLAGEILKQRMGLQATFVPYKTLAQVVSDIIGGHLDYAFGDPQGYLPHVRSGRLRALAVTTRTQSVNDWQSVGAPVRCDRVPHGFRGYAAKRISARSGTLHQRSTNPLRVSAAHPSTGCDRRSRTAST